MKHYVILAFSTSLAVAQATWSPVTSVPTSSNLWAVASSGSTLVAVGDNGTVVSSTNGVAWTSRNSGTPSTLKYIIWGNNQFMAAGGGDVITSPDGLTWTKVSTKNFTSLAWTGTQYIAASGATYIESSPNGVSWTTRPLPLSLTSQWSAYSLTLVGAGEAGMITIGPMTHNNLGSMFRNMIYVLKPTIDWEWGSLYNTYNTGNTLPNAYFSLGDKVIGVGPLAGLIWWSNGGESFSSSYFGKEIDFRGAARRDSTLVVVGASGGIYSATGPLPTGSAHYPTHPNSIKHESGTAVNLNGVANIGDRFVAVGDGGRIFISSSSTLWSTSIKTLGSNANTKISSRVDGSRFLISLPSIFQNQDVRIVVYRLSGEKVLEMSSREVAKISVDITELSRGTYWVQVFGNGNSVSTSFTKL